jgi:hypothetical protein
MVLKSKSMVDQQKCRLECGVPCCLTKWDVVLLILTNCTSSGVDKEHEKHEHQAEPSRST